MTKALHLKNRSYEITMKMNLQGENLSANAFHIRFQMIMNRSKIHSYQIVKNGNVNVNVQIPKTFPLKNRLHQIAMHLNLRSENPDAKTLRLKIQPQRNEKQLKLISILSDYRIGRFKLVLLMVGLKQEIHQITANLISGRKGCSLSTSLIKTKNCHIGIYIK